jgi:hypothetical protein
MTGKITVGTIQDTAGTTVASTYVTNGSAKHWIHLVGTGTISALDSFNSSSISDLGTGRYQTNFSNNMNNANYAIVAADVYQTSGFYTPTTSSHNIFCNSAGPAPVDTVVSTMLQGDLA